MPAHRVRQTRRSTNSTTDSLSGICDPFTLIGDADKFVESLPLYRACHGTLSRSGLLLHPDETLTESSPDDLQPKQQPVRNSHGRKHPKGHIPRPRNGFIVFRSDLHASGKISKSVENHHGKISQVAGILWRSLSKDRQAFYNEKAEEEKALHKMMYPNYKFSPVQRRGDDDKSKKRKKAIGDGVGDGVGDGDERRSELVAQLLAQGNSGEELKKAISKVDINDKIDSPAKKLTIHIPPRPIVKKLAKVPAVRRSLIAKALALEGSKPTLSNTFDESDLAINTKGLRSIKLDDVAEKASINFFRRRLSPAAVESENEEVDAFIGDIELEEDVNEDDVEREPDTEVDIPKNGIGPLVPPFSSSLEDVIDKLNYPFRRDGTIDPSAIFSPDAPSNYPIFNEYLNRHLRAPSNSSRSSSQLDSEDIINDFIGYYYDKMGGSKSDPFLNEFGFDFSTIDDSEESSGNGELGKSGASSDNEEAFLKKYYED